MKTIIILCTVFLVVGCEITLNSGEDELTIGVDHEKNRNDVEDGSNAILENMNIELIQLKDLEAEAIVVSEVDDFGMLVGEVGVFDIYDGKVLVPIDIKLKGIYHFELISEEGSVEIISSSKKFGKESHSRKKLEREIPSYLLGHSEKELSDEVMYLVYERGYPLRASFKFASRKVDHHGHMEHTYTDELYREEF